MSLPFERPSASSFPAKYPGTCDDCGGEFERGTEIRYSSSDLVHADPEECSDTISLDSRPMKVCQKCFLVHAGECF